MTPAQRAGAIHAAFADVIHEDPFTRCDGEQYEDGEPCEFFSAVLHAIVAAIDEERDRSAVRDGG